MVFSYFIGIFRHLCVFWGANDSNHDLMNFNQICLFLKKRASFQTLLNFFDQLGGLSLNSSMAFFFVAPHFDLAFKFLTQRPLVKATYHSQQPSRTAPELAPSGPNLSKTASCNCGKTTLLPYSHLYTR